MKIKELPSLNQKQILELVKRRQKNNKLHNQIRQVRFSHQPYGIGLGNSQSESVIKPYVYRDRTPPSFPRQEPQTKYYQSTAMHNLPKTQFLQRFQKDKQNLMKKLSKEKITPKIQTIRKNLSPQIHHDELKNKNVIKQLAKLNKVLIGESLQSTQFTLRQSNTNTNMNTPYNSTKRESECDNNMYNQRSTIMTLNTNHQEEYSRISERQKSFVDSEATKRKSHSILNLFDAFGPQRVNIYDQPKKQYRPSLNKDSILKTFQSVQQRKSTMHRNLSSLGLELNIKAIQELSNFQDTIDENADESDEKSTRTLIQGEQNHGKARISKHSFLKFKKSDEKRKLIFAKYYQRQKKLSRKEGQQKDCKITSFYKSSPIYNILFKKKTDRHLSKKIQPKNQQKEQQYSFSPKPILQETFKINSETDISHIRQAIQRHVCYNLETKEFIDAFKNHICLVEENKVATQTKQRQSVPKYYAANYDWSFVDILTFEDQIKMPEIKEEPQKIKQQFKIIGNQEKIERTINFQDQAKNCQPESDLIQKGLGTSSLMQTFIHLNLKHCQRKEIFIPKY